MKKYIYLIFGSIILGFLSFVFYFIQPQLGGYSSYVSDFARVEKEIIDSQYYAKKVEDIQEKILSAKQQGLKISIAGKKYSGGGHTFTKNGLVIDMSRMNNIIKYDKINRLITVESGITWGEIQQYINEDNLAIKVMQSSNIFSVGGSISSNIHGRDPRFGTIIETIESFRIITAQGKLLNVSREENTDLFGSVIGGFGLFGVITDVTISLNENETYIKNSFEGDYKEYGEYIQKNIKNHDEIGLHYGRLSIVKGQNFLKEFFITNYKLGDNKNIDNSLISEQYILRNRFFFNISREFDWAKLLRWELQKYFTDNTEKIEIISRNNAMNPPIKFISYYNKAHTDILQEYFIPLNNFDEFIDELREIMQTNDVNLLNVTTRYISSGNEVLLNYNPVDMVAVVLYMNVGLDEKSQEQVKKYTQELINIIDRFDGRYYLIYQNYATKYQMYKIYDNVNKFKEIKKKYDPDGLFSNKFSEKYNLK